MEMCRFYGPNDFEYRKVASALRRMINSISKQPLTKEKSTVSGAQTKLLLESLRFDQINARQMTIKKAHVKTCKWLFTKSEYLDWLDQAKLSEHHGFLWIKGKPGTGKSTLMKSLLANTKKLMKDKVVISFFFNARGEELEKNTLGTYQSLLLQLLERLPVLESVFETLDLSIKTIGETHQWSVDSLKTLLEEAILRLGETPVVCLIDALDECDERQIRDMISFFEHVGQLTVSASISFQVCFSSRHYPHITIGSGITLVLEGQEGHTHDITTYLESELKIGHSKIAGQIRHEIQEKASGVFLWVVLVVEILNKEHDSGRIPALRRRLRETPGDLHELFNNILTRDSRNRDELILCLQWILFAKQPLTPEQLYFAIISGCEPQDLSIWDPEEISISDIQRFILNASKGLAETTTSDTPKIQFIHESVKDFLEKENGLGRIWSDLESNFKGQSHERLEQCCMKYIDIDFATRLKIGKVLPKAFSDEAAKLRKKVSIDLPFLEYATHHVLYHADMAEGFGITQESFIREFQLTRWIWLNNLLEKHHVRRHTPKASLLYLLAEYDMSNLIRIHPSILSFIEIGDERYGCPLLAALATSSDKSVLAFLQACAASQTSGTKLQQLCQQFEQDRGEIEKIGRDFQFPKHGNILSYLVGVGDMTLFEISCEMVDFSPDTAGSYGRTPLSTAAELGHESIAKCLLDHNASIDLKDKKGRTPLSYAASNGHAAVVRTLLDHNSSTETEDQYGKTPLWYAAERGDDSIVKMLLENKTAINSQNVNGRTLLCLAAENGHETIVRLLLEKKAVVDSQRADGQTPLMLAAKNGHEAVVKVLLENNAVLDSFDGYRRTPLMIAAWGGHEAVVKVLLENNAVLESQNKIKATSLSGAAQDGHERIVKLLLEKKAVVDSQRTNGQTPLMLAAKNGHEAVVKMLLENMAATDLRDEDGLTPLDLAASCRHESIMILLLSIELKDIIGPKPLLPDTARNLKAFIKLLLDTGKFDVNSRVHNDYTILLFVAQYGYVDIVKLLLDTAKVNVNLKNLEGNTSLSLAAQHGHDNTFKLLLETGEVDVNSKNNADNTPLSLAAQWGRGNIVKLLLDTDRVDADLKNHEGDTPLSLAARYSRYYVVNLLLKTGKVDVNSKNNAGQTPLLHATQITSEDIVKLLLETGEVDVNSKNDAGETPLMMAAAASLNLFGRNDAIVMSLLDTGKIDVHTRNNAGQTAQMLAVKHENPGIVKLLEQYAASKPRPTSYLIDST